MNCCDANGNCNQGRDCPVRKEIMNARKYPRTLNEAFGPYCSPKIDEPVERYDWQDRVIIAAGYCAIIGLIVIACFDI